MKKLGLAALFLIGSIGAALAQAFPAYPTVGVPADTECLQYGNGGVCNQYRPAGPSAITGNETIPADTNLTGGQNPQTVRIDINSLGVGATTVNTTTGTGQNPVVTNGVSNYIYAGAGTATFATFTLPSTPTNGQRLCIYNAGSGILTLTSVVVGTVGQVFVQGAAPTSIPVQVASGAQATVTNAGVCWQYQTSNTTWYRIQ